MRPRSLKNIALNLLLMLVAVVICLLLGEIAARMSDYYPRVRTPPYLFANHSKTGWVLNPGGVFRLRTLDGPVVYRINDRGNRGPRVPQKGRYRIDVVGDSTTFGWGVNDDDTFVRIVEKRLQASGRGLDVVNLGIPGFGTWQGFERLREYARRWGDPNLVIYAFSTNDPVDNIAGRKVVVNGIRMGAHYRFKPLLSLVGHLYQRSTLVAMAADVWEKNSGNARQKAAKKVQLAGVSDVRDRKDFISTRRHVKRMIHWTKQRGIPMLVVIISGRVYNAPLKEVLAQEKVGVFEFGALFDARGGMDRFVLKSDSHWAPSGHRLAADALSDLLEKSGWLPEAGSSNAGGEK
ncbi:MAG: hypothetical protein HQL53_00695 [Magnetococcales bacterium]|nr:hypothetical protein [Magnetococcales bacterium]